MTLCRLPDSFFRNRRASSEFSGLPSIFRPIATVVSAQRIISFSAAGSALDLAAAIRLQ